MNVFVRYIDQRIVPRNRAADDRKCQILCARLIILSCLAIFLTACSGGASATFDDYQQRLERLLQSQAESAQPHAVSSMPRVHHLRVAPEEVSLSLLDSMRLNRCELGQLVAERNSSLGRVRTQSLQLYYELRLIPALERCLQDAELSDRLKSELSNALTTKVENLPLAIHNFITTDETFRAQFRSSVHTLQMPLSQQQYQDIRSSIAALDYFAHQLQQASTQTPAVDSQEWQTQLRHIGQITVLSRYWQSQRYSLSRMQQLTHLLSSVDQLQCHNGRASDQAQYLSNVLMHIYIPQIQATLSQYDSIGRQLEPLLTTFAALSVKTEWGDYLFELNALHHQLRAESQRHAEQWQRLLAPCGLQPKIVTVESRERD